MKWTLGILTALLAAAAAAPSSRKGPKTSTSVNMSQEDNSEPITIEKTQNIFGNVVSVTPPDAESIELKHLHDDTRFYPDYDDNNPVDNDHFPSSQGPPRTKRRSTDYNDLNYEMYLDSLYARKRRDAEQPFRIDLNIPDDSDLSSSASTSEVQAARSPVSDLDSVSTQITYVIISDDDSSSDEAVQTAMEQMRADQTTQVIEQGTSNLDSSSIRAQRSLNDHRRSGADTDSSGAHLLTRKGRQIPYYRLPDFLNYRVGRSASEPDSDDTQPDDAQGVNMKDLSMNDTGLKLLDAVARLPEYSYDLYELTRSSSTYVDGKLQSYYAPKQEIKRSLTSTERSELESKTEPTLDIVTASYPLGIDATKDNLTLPEGNFLGPRIYAQGQLLQEEQPAVTGIAAPMEKEASIPVGNGSEIDTVYSAPVNNLNLPLIIPVVGPTSHPGEEPRIELSVPSGYVPYIIQLSPTNQNATDTHSTVAEHISTSEEQATKSETSLKPLVPTNLSLVPAIITSSTPSSSGSELSTQTNALPRSEESAMEKSSEESETSQGAEGSVTSSSLVTTASLKTPPTNQPTQGKSTSTISGKGEQIALKQKRAEWKTISSAPAGHVEESSEQTASWEFASNAPTSGIAISQPTSTWRSVPIVEEGIPKQTAMWESVSTASAGDVEFPKQTPSWKAVPVGEEELPKQQIARWKPISNAPAGEVETSTTQTENGGVSSTPPLECSSEPLQPTSEMSDEEAPAERKRKRVIPILEKNSVMSPNGSFRYSFKSGNGIQVEESGYLKKERVQEGSTDSDGAQAVQGSYSYTAPDGRIISVRYVADEKGFRPEVEDLPK